MSVISAAKSKRAPLSALSTNVPIPARQSARLHDAFSAENPLHHEKSRLADETPVIKNKELQQLVCKAAPLASDEMTSAIKERMVDVDVEMTTKNTVLQTENSKLSPRALKRPRVPSKSSRKKKIMTLAMHISTYGQMHIIEYMSS
jgi:hypothetical protein